MASRKCVFLDRDGVINEDNPNYVFQTNKFILLDGVKEAIHAFKKSGFLVIVITNQSGIAKGLYSREEMQACHELMQNLVGHQIDDIYYAPYHESVSNSLSRKPGSLMFERAIAKYDIDVTNSWMIGDKKRDIIPAKKLGIRTIQVGVLNDRVADFHSESLFEASKKILKG